MKKYLLHIIIVLEPHIHILQRRFNFMSKDVHKM